MFSQVISFSDIHYGVKSLIVENTLYRRSLFYIMSCDFSQYSNISGDELFSDTYPIKLVDDCVYEVTGKVSHALESPDAVAECVELTLC